MKPLKTKALAAAVLASAITGLSAQASDITIISFGGANTQAQIESMYKPWQSKTGNTIIVGEYNGEMARVKAMVDTKSVTWHLIDSETPELVRGCEEGMFEELDSGAFLNEEDFLEGALTPCGVGFFVWSMVIGYDKAKLSAAPNGWQDFWDVKKIPGKRGLRKGAKYTLEFALMADGVPAKEVYQVLATQAGQDRAFAKLDELKPHIQWWEAGAQPPQFLAAGDVVMSSVFNGRINAVRDTSTLDVAWNGGIYDIDAWAIPRGAKDQETVKDFIAFSVSPEAQKGFAEIIGYGPTNTKAMALIAPEVQANLPTSPANIKGQVAMDVTFWADWGEQLEQRFNAWAAR